MSSRVEESDFCKFCKDPINHDWLNLLNYTGDGVLIGCHHDSSPWAKANHDQDLQNATVLAEKQRFMVDSRELRTQIAQEQEIESWRLFNLNSHDQSEEATQRRITINEVRWHLIAIAKGTRASV